MIIVITSDLREDTEIVQPVANCENEYQKLKTKLVESSSNAQRLFEDVERSPKTVGIFLNNRDMTSEYYPPAPEFFEHLGAPRRCDGGFVVLDLGRPITARSGKGKDSRSQVLPIEISLAHELGHAKQYLERTEWFMERFNKRVNGDREAQLEIEDDNLANVERPICHDYGMIEREKYD